MRWFWKIWEKIFGRVPAPVVIPSPKKPRTQKKPRNRPRYCSVNGKREYSESEAKLRAREKSNTYLKLHAYCCPFETHWHISHQKQRISMKKGRHG